MNVFAVPFLAVALVMLYLDRVYVFVVDDDDDRGHTHPIHIPNPTRDHDSVVSMRGWDHSQEV